MPRAKIPPLDQGFRRQRLADLCGKDGLGSQAAVAQLLGCTPGYVGQLLRGTRAIGEKTISAVHAARGGRFRGWFDASPSGGSMADDESWPLLPFLTRSTWEALTPAQRTVVAWEASKAVQAAIETIPPTGPFKKALPSR